MHVIDNTIRFSCTSLTGMNKGGNLKKDAAGYYEICVGALNVHNSIGQYYPFNEARVLFEESGSLMRRIKSGKLTGELGHPKKLPGMTDEQFAARCMALYEDNICCHFRDIWLDMDTMKDPNTGKPIVAIMANVRPAGKYGYVLADALENPHHNVCFSIRSFTDDRIVRGQYTRFLRHIVTWDFVSEQGISSAEKYRTPTLESMSDTVFSRGQLERAASQGVAGVGNESVTATATELFRALDWNSGTKAAGFSAW